MDQAFAAYTGTCTVEGAKRQVTPEKFKRMSRLRLPAKLVTVSWRDLLVIVARSDACHPAAMIE